MKRLVLALLAPTLVAPVGAAWVPFMQSDTSVVYIDSTSVRKEGHLRKAWVLVDLHERDSSGARSKRGQSEIDCNENRMRIHDLSGFAGKMASGESVYAFRGSTEWVPIPPNTPLSERIKLVCSR